MKKNNKPTLSVVWKGEWYDSLMWCPSQIYRKFEYNGKEYELYGRWRWNDPWSFYIWGIPLIGDSKIGPVDLGWGMKQEDPIEKVHKFAEKLLKEYLIKNSEILFG